MSNTRSARIDRELTFREAAAALGRKDDPTGRKLRELVLARERQTGKRIAIRLAGPKRPKLRVTLGALYRAFPEARSAHVDDLALALRELGERFDDRTRLLVREILDRDVDPRIEKLEKRAALTERYLAAIHELEKRE